MAVPGRQGQAQRKPHEPVQRQELLGRAKLGQGSAGAQGSRSRPHPSKKEQDCTRDPWREVYREYYGWAEAPDAEKAAGAGGAGHGNSYFSNTQLWGRATTVCHPQTALRLVTSSWGSSMARQDPGALCHRCQGTGRARGQPGKGRCHHRCVGPARQLARTARGPVLGKDRRGWGSSREGVWSPGMQHSSSYNWSKAREHAGPRRSTHVQPGKENMASTEPSPFCQLPCFPADLLLFPALSNSRAKAQ